MRARSVERLMLGVAVGLAAVMTIAYVGAAVAVVWVIVHFVRKFW